MQQQQQTHKEPSFLNISLYRQTIYISISFFPLNFIYILPTTTTLPKSYNYNSIKKLHIQGNSRSLSFNYGRQETLCSFFS